MFVCKKEGREEEGREKGRDNERQGTKYVSLLLVVSLLFNVADMYTSVQNINCSNPRRRQRESTV